MPKKATRRGKRYTAAQRKRILDTASREKLTGAQVAKRFGVSTLTFYRWRGPVRRRKPAASRQPRNGRVKVDAKALRREVQAQVRKLLPQIIREEVTAALKS